MINPNGDDFVEDNPMAAPKEAEEQRLKETQPRLQRTARQVSAVAGETWQQTRDRAGAAYDRTETFLRENPVPTIVGALALGLAIGWALRYATTREEKEIEIESPLGRFSFLSLPFLWPVVKSLREKYDDSADAVKDGVDRLKKVDLDRYTKPVRKRLKSWI
jgi:ElaB/YqjD/DUF883 family membrane-anchored ribosome-binding protein